MLLKQDIPGFFRVNFCCDDSWFVEIKEKLKKRETIAYERSEGSG